jgi:hypothetical protein
VKIANKNDFIEIEVDGIPISIKESNLPSVIGGQIDKYKELEKSIAESLEKAEKARENADSARKKPAGFFQQKDAIEAIQKSLYDSAETMMVLAESQKVSFEFQTKLAEISKFLLIIGYSNIALNRATIRQLNLEQERASRGEISELVGTELSNVIDQLIAQQDILEKQDKLEKRVEKLSEKQNKLEERINEFYEKREEQSEEIEKYRDLINANDKKINKKLKTESSSIRKSFDEKTEDHKKSVEVSLKKIKTEFESVKKGLNEIKEIKPYSEDKFSSIKKIFFIICGIIGVSFVLSIISLVITIINK